MRVVSYEIKNSLNFRFSLPSAAAIALICGLSECYTSASGRTFTIIELFLGASKDALLMDPMLNRYYVFSCGIGSWTQLLLPLVLAASYLYVYSNERKENYNRILLIREGKLRYCFGKLISIMLSGAVIMLVGSFLFFCMVYLKFPALDEYSAEQIQTYMVLGAGWGETGAAAVRFLKFAIYGACTNAFAYVASAFFTDKYILICLPIMSKYVLMQIASRLLTDAISCGDEHLMQMGYYLTPENILMDGVGNIIPYVVVPVAVYLLGFVISYVSLKIKGEGIGFE